MVEEWTGGEGKLWGDWEERREEKTAVEMLYMREELIEQRRKEID